LIKPTTTSTLVIDKQGSRFWLNQRKELHRLDGPALEADSGYKEWWINGKLHRTNGPSVEGPEILIDEYHYRGCLYEKEDLKRML